MNFVGPFSIQSVIERLKGLDAFKVVAGAAEFDAAATATSAPTPAAYVLLAAEKASGDRGGTTGGLVTQRVDVLLGVVYCVRNQARADLGSGAVVDHEHYTALARSRLLGFTPVGAQMPIEFQAGRLMRYGAGTLWWQDTFRTQYRIEVRT